MSARLLRRESPHMRAGSLHARGLEARARGRADWALTLLGARTCLALADVPDWRWGLAGDATPWYGAMRLYRQPSPGDWGAVFAAIAASPR